VPSLDNRSFDDLVAEARRLLPVYDPGWTDHNPSDPGITLVELFAYLTEMLLYRLDRVTVENQRKFLKLLAGPSWTPGPDMTSDIRAVLQSVRARERAITAADFEHLAVEDFNDWLTRFQRAQSLVQPLDEWWQVTGLDRGNQVDQPSSLPAVARACCSPSRNLDRGTEATRLAPTLGHVSLTILSTDGARQPPQSLTAALAGYLDQRRTLTTRLHVVGPRYAPISAEIVVAAKADASTTAVSEAVGAQVKSFLDPLIGGEGQGWPFGRPVYASELYKKIETVAGVDYVTDLMLSSECAAGEARCVEASPIWHPKGDFVGLAVERPYLPLARDAQSVVVAPSASFVPVRVSMELLQRLTGDAPILKRLAKMAVREFFHPLHDGPGPQTPTDTTLEASALRNRLAAAVASVGEVTSLELEAAPGRLVYGNLGVAAGEVVDWTTHLTVLNELTRATMQSSVDHGG
jgi:hypothetical protein